MKIPAAAAPSAALIARSTSNYGSGIFDIWTHTGMIMYRQALVLPGGITASTRSARTMLVGAITLRSAIIRRSSSWCGPANQHRKP